MARGSRHGNAKLTEDDVRFILAYPRTLGSGLYLAERFGVSKSAISKIRMGDKWQHLMRPAA